MTEENVYKWREEDLPPKQLLHLWRGDLTLPVPTLAVIGTLAFALKLAEPALAICEAEARAREIWESRDKKRFG